MSPLQTPHDRLFHFAFQDPEVAKAELRAVLSPELLAHFELEKMTLVKDRLVDEELENLFTDVLYHVPIAGQDAFVWTLLEHQSSVDPLMPFRLLQYDVGIWSRLVLGDERRRRAKLPLIVPIVVEHAASADTAPRRFSELYDASAELLELARPFCPDFAYVVDKLDEDEIHEREGSALYRMTLAMLKTRGEGNAERIAAYRQAFIELMDSGNRAAIHALLMYVVEVARSERPIPLEAAITADRGLEDQVATYAERLIEKGMKRGREEGRQEGREVGREEGRLEGRATLLVELLETKFGALSSELIARVRQSGEDEQKRWTARILSATKLDDIFEDA